MAISILRIINFLSPKDRRSRLVAADVPYGSDARQKLDIYAPTEASGSLPVVFFIYGGSWSDGDRHNYRFAGRALAAQGFVCVIADYRLVPHIEYPQFLEDCAQAFHWVVDNIAGHGGDPGRIALMGHSAGAYNAAMLALDPRWLGADRAAVRGLVGLAGPYDFLPLDVASTREAFGEVRDLPSTQPVNLASAGDPPALLVAGANDTLVRPRQTALLAERLRASGVMADTRLYPKVGHVGVMTALAKPLRGKAPVLADVTAFATKVTAKP